MIAGLTNDRFDIDTHRTSRFLFSHFNNLRRDSGEESYEVKHNIVSDDQHALESLQNKDWSYFIKRLLEVSSADIPWLSKTMPKK